MARASQSLSAKSSARRASDKRSRAFHHGDLALAAKVEARIAIVQLGVESLSLREIAARIGVTHRALYRHYSDRQDLLAALAADETQELTKRLEQSIAEHPSDQRVRALLKAYVQYALAYPRLYAMIFSLPLNVMYENRSRLNTPLRQLIDVAAQVFRKANERSEMTRDRVVRALGTAHGLILLFQAGVLKGHNKGKIERYIVEAVENQSIGLKKAPKPKDKSPESNGKSRTPRKKVERVKIIG